MDMGNGEATRALYKYRGDVTLGEVKGILGRT